MSVSAFAAVAIAAAASSPSRPLVIAPRYSSPAPKVAATSRRLLFSNPHPLVVSSATCTPAMATNGAAAVGLKKKELPPPPRCSVHRATLLAIRMESLL
ncbi:Os09g0330532 [Oryza sativa Japonica Group]|uniref:Os09g0330532 protein n=1 Tax=Oryza sativa subsp. japonica TaxID=39947 RepID=A0A0P0XKX7_ORYSJ|nr:Os09g0330532 [Oryza sativa Japonica Group]